MNINKILLTGTVDSKPILTRLPQSSTPVCSFILRVEERFVNSKEVVNIRPNYFKIESLGRQANEAFEKIKQGGRYLIDGYLRQEHNQATNTDIIKVRTYGIVADHSDDSLSYRQGIKKAIQVLSKSKNPTTAAAELEEIILSAKG